LRVSPDKEELVAFTQRLYQMAASLTFGCGFAALGDPWLLNLLHDLTGFEVDPLAKRVELLESK